MLLMLGMLCAFQACHYWQSCASFQPEDFVIRGEKCALALKLLGKKNTSAKCIGLLHPIETCCVAEWSMWKCYWLDISNVPQCLPWPSCQPFFLPLSSLKLCIVQMEHVKYCTSDTCSWILFFLTLLQVKRNPLLQACIGWQKMHDFNVVNNDFFWSLVGWSWNMDISSRSLIVQWFKANWVSASPPCGLQSCKRGSASLMATVVHTAWTERHWMVYSFVLARHSCHQC